MNLITNGSFESGLIAPWIDLWDKPHTGEIIQRDEKNWLTIKGGNSPFDSVLVQKFEIPPQPWSNNLVFEITTKAFAAGGTADGHAEKDNGGLKFEARLILWITINYGPDSAWTDESEIIATAVEDRHRFSYKLSSSKLPTSGEITIMNTPSDRFLRTDIVATGISLYNM